MPTAASTLIDRTRRYVRDWPDQDVLTASVGTSTTTLTVADGTLYTKNWAVQVEDEAMVVSANGSATSVPVRRGRFGTTAATHASASAVLIRPAFTNLEILDALNSALDAVYPLLYRPVSTEWTGVTATDYEYAIPNMATLARPIPYLSKIEFQRASGEPFIKIKSWRVLRGDTPFVKFTQVLESGGTLRFTGFGPFAQLTSSADTLDTFYPAHAESLLVEYAAQHLLTSGEAGRVRQDTGVRDDREAANRVGSASAAANQIYQRWLRKLNAAAMPPMPPHVVSIG